jgi:hypothetical protein
MNHTESVPKLVIQHYRDIASLLNLIPDDDERERVQGRGEEELNDMLYEGATSRKLADHITRAGFRLVQPVAEVVQLHSYRVDRISEQEFRQLTNPEGGAA